MRKMLLFLLLALLLCAPFAAAAVEGPQYIGIAVQGVPDNRLLEAMEERKVRATFFLDTPSWEKGRRILDGGHEIGLTVPDEWNGLSRRDINWELNARRALLPDQRVRLLLSRRRVSDGVRQVAQVKGMTLLQNALDPWAEQPMGATLLARLRPGDILLLDGENPEQVIHILALLQSRGFRPVAVSELARLQL